MTITKRIERGSGGRFLVVTAELRIGHPSLSDGFSVTGSTWEPTKTQSGQKRHELGREADSSGAIHGEILAVAPELAPLVAVHLSSPDGVPFHALANGWHFYSGASRRWEESRGDTWSNPDGLSDQQRAARTLRILAEELPTGLDRTAFAAFAETLRPRWAAEAEVARAILEAL